MLENFFNFLQSSRFKMYFSCALIGLFLIWGAWTVSETLDRLTLPEPTLTLAAEQSFRPPVKPSRTLAQSLQNAQVFTVENLSTLPKTVGLTISGVFLDIKGTGSYVVAALTGQPSQSYAVGDSLSSGQRVYKISANAIIFLQDGELSQASFGFAGINFPTQRPNGLFSRT